ncbi:DNA-formamidopyrimidine glycosylase [Paenibacillus sp. NPDC058071]|uniref:DNA-formamidopyrimidine glycosylase n=1 Tax=Paenibacillus sp. NPDC058071 TaxID=3346326 RepID=UPI0036D843F4
MPELPEVETIRRTLNELVAGKTIKSVTVNLPRIIQKPAEPVEFAAALEGQTISGVERRGKFLRFIMDDLVLVSHLRMEGNYSVYPSDEPIKLHTHVLFHFEDGTDLRYKDVRQFGTMHIFRQGEDLLEKPLNKLGIEPVGNPAFTLAALKKLLSGRKTKMKPLLLNQEYVVGLGNIYVDESLFLAKIHPERTADSLTPAEWKRLYEAIIETLDKAIEAGGSSVYTYVNSQGEMGLFQHQFQVYDRKGEPCVRCGSPIEKFFLAGRGTHICTRCQKKPVQANGTTRKEAAILGTE